MLRQLVGARTGRLFRVSCCHSSSVNEDHLKRFREILGDRDVVTDPDVLDVHNQDWLKQYRGHSPLMLQPRSAESMSKVLEYCNSNKISVVPQGGNTGLVGGSIPLGEEVIISLLKMNQIRTINKTSGIVTCDAGITLEQLNNYCEENGFIVPLDLGAKGSCTIGGNISTNAGGIRFLRYGTLHGTVSGLEVVLANGEIINTLDSLRKDNTGYDIKQLFIGAEGSLGVVTGVSIQCAPKPTSVQVAMFNCESFEKVLDTFRLSRQRLGEILSAFEFVDAPSYDLSVKHKQIPNPMEVASPFYVLIETSGSNESHDKEKLFDFLDEATEGEFVSNGIIASDFSQISDLWSIRESVSECLSKEGYVYKYDLSLPYEKFYSIVESLKERLPASLATIYSYGHVGDANIHLNIVSPKFSAEVKNIIEPWVYEYCRSCGGSVSAEHGIGQMKTKYLHFNKSDAHLKHLYGIKQLFDPNSILNPRKVFPSTVQTKQ